MTKNDESKNTRQVFATIDEELYLAAKARAAEMRVPLRELMEIALLMMEHNLRLGKKQHIVETIWLIKDY